MIVSPKEVSEGLAMAGLQRHYTAALDRFNENNIIVCAIQGSQNYGLEYENSDIDTKLIITPLFKDICLNRKPVSTTFIHANSEHTDDKDIRLYVETFRKQNLNFLEILFTKYYITNPLYAAEWNRLIQKREEIAHMNRVRALKSMQGIALEKYHAMSHPYPSKIDIITKYGYDGKQVHHLLRVEDFLKRYIANEPYADCMYPSPQIVDHLMAYKRQEIPYEVAREEADNAISRINDIASKYTKMDEHEKPEMRDLLEDVSYNIMKISVQREFNI